MLIGNVETYCQQDPPNVLGLHYKDGKLPEPNVEISQPEFLGLMSHERAHTVGFETVTLPDSTGRWETHYWFLGGMLIAMATQYARSSYIRNGMFVGDGAADDCGIWYRFFRCGCQHTRMVWADVGEKRTRGICPDCGYTAEEDSNG